MGKKEKDLPLWLLYGEIFISTLTGYGAYTIFLLMDINVYLSIFAGFWTSAGMGYLFSTFNFILYKK